MAGAREKKLVIAGLGPGAPEDVPPGVIERCLGANRVFLRTERHPSVPALRARGVSYVSFDSLYEAAGDYSALYTRMAEEVLACLEQAVSGTVAYLVPGNPMVAERSVEILLQKTRVPVEIVGARSFAEAALEAARVCASSGYTVLDAYELRYRKSPPYYAPYMPCVIGQVHDRFTASWAKLYLMEFLAPETGLFVVRGAGIPGYQRVTPVELSDLDAREDFDHLTAVVVPAVPDERQATGLGAWIDLLSIVAELRSDHGCPWDKEQTHESLIPFTVEEAYELALAIRSGKAEDIVEELGDLLLQIAMHVQIGREERAFDDRDVISRIIRKLVTRHPHVFASERAPTSENVVRRWEEIKKRERETREPGSLMDSLTPGLPSLVMAHKQQVLAASVGFDWKYPGEVLDKVKEELGELEKAMRDGHSKAVGEEIGDLLYAIVNLSRHLAQDAEICLRTSVEKFSTRFREMERIARISGVKLEDLDEKSLDDLWNTAKAWKDLEQERS